MTTAKPIRSKTDHDLLFYARRAGSGKALHLAEAGSGKPIVCGSGRQTHAHGACRDAAQITCKRCQTYAAAFCEEVEA